MPFIEPNMIEELRSILAKAGPVSDVPTDPIKAAEYFAAFESTMLPLIQLISRGNVKKMASIAVGISAINLEYYKKAVLEEYINSGAAGKLDETLGRK